MKKMCHRGHQEKNTNARRSKSREAAKTFLWFRINNYSNNLSCGKEKKYFNESIDYVLIVRI